MSGRARSTSSTSAEIERRLREPRRGDDPELRRLAADHVRRLVAERVHLLALLRTLRADRQWAKIDELIAVLERETAEPEASDAAGE